MTVVLTPCTDVVCLGRMSMCGPVLGVMNSPTNSKSTYDLKSITTLNHKDTYVDNM